MPTGHLHFIGSSPVTSTKYPGPYGVGIFLGIMFNFDRINSLHPGVQATIDVCYSSIQELIVPRIKSEDRIHSLVPLKI